MTSRFGGNLSYRSEFDALRVGHPTRRIEYLDRDEIAVLKHDPKNPIWPERDRLMEHFGLTGRHIAGRAKELLKTRMAIADTDKAMFLHSPPAGRMTCSS